MSGEPNEPNVAEPMVHAMNWEESCELIAELTDTADANDSCPLRVFAGLISQLIAIDEQGSGDEVHAFIESAMSEIRLLVDAGEWSSPQLDALQHDAVERWSHLLVQIDDCGGLDTFPGMSQWNGGVDGDDADAGLDLVAPSAEEISSIIDRVAHGGPAEQSTGAVEESGNESPAIATEHTSSPDVIASLDAELREAFLDDATSGIGRMEAALLHLESDPAHGESRAQICRELHSLKGASASVGLSQLADELHELEELLRQDEEASRNSDIESLLRAVDSMRKGIFGPSDACHVPDYPAAPTTGPATPGGTLCAANPGSIPENSHDDESVRVNAAQLNRLMDMLAELVMLRNDRENEVAELQEMYHELVGSVSKMRLLGDDVHDQSASTTSLQLSEVANDVLEVAQTVRDCARPIADGNAAVSHFIRQFRQELVELKRTPVAGLFRRLQRVVRDAARSEGKQVDLQLVGDDAGMERSLQQRLYEPLLHILRNAVCHGIESPEQRNQAGKSATGTITLEAQSGPDMFVIEIRDDGGGLDFDAIRRRGIESGLLRPDQLATRDDLSNLIFQPGFSTRAAVNQVAGRGVGMDVVASTLQRMRGWIEVDSEAQRGTRIRLGFPLPSVIQHAMVFRAGTQLFALPMQSVSSAGGGGGHSIELRFAELVGIANPAGEAACQQLALSSSVAHESVGHSARISLLVDQILGPEELVVRPLPNLLRHHPYCCGATLSSTGGTVLLLDAHQVNQQCKKLAHAASESFGEPSTEPTERQVESTVRVLVADDSLSARRRVVRSLQRYRVEIVEAGDGREALSILNKQEFAAVFSDMEMPHVGGMELLAGIKALPQSRRPPVVIISSRTEDEFIQRATELGAHGYLSKPLTDDALDEAIRGIRALRDLQHNSDTNLTGVK